MIDGPGPPATARLTGAPARLVPIIRCARIRREDPGRVETRDTHRILLVWSLEGGESSGVPHWIAAIRPDAPNSYGIRGRASLNPARAHTGNTPIRTSERQPGTVTR